MTKRLFTILAGAAVRHPRSVLAIALVCVALSVALAASTIELRTSNLDLVDPDLPPVRRFLDFASEFGTPNMLVVVLEGKDEAGLGAAVDRLSPVLRGLPGVRAVLDGIPLDETVLDELGLERYVFSDDGRMAFVFVQPDDPSSSAATIAPFVSDVRDALAGADLDSLEVRAGLTGMPAYALDDRDIIRRDVSRLSLVSLALVALLFAISFRALRRPVLAMAALLAGVGLTLGCVALYPGHLTLLSAFFASVLFGLGSDYGIHLVNRVEESLAVGASEHEAILEAVSAVGSALATGALTTAAMFFAMCFSGFRGFAELGAIAGVGVLLCLAVMLTVLPAMLVAFGSRRRCRPSLLGERIGTALWRVQSRPLALVVALASLTSLLLGSPGFDTNYLNLEPEGSNAVRLEREMVARSDLSPAFAAFVVGSREEAADRTNRLLDDPTVGDAHSIADLDALPDAERIRRLLPDGALASLESDRGRFAVYAYPEGNVWEPGVQREFLDHMRAIDPDVTGIPFLGSSMIERSRRALHLTATIGSVAMALIVFLGFRRVWPSFLAAVPTLLTIPGMLGLMGLLGIPFNPLNVMALPIVIGIAVDDGVHMVHRFVAERGDLRRTLAGTGRSVVLTSATTLAAFGSLTLTDHRGLRSFAEALTIGVATALVLSVFVLPALLSVFSRPVLGSARARSMSSRAPSSSTSNADATIKRIARST